VILLVRNQTHLTTSRQGALLEQEIDNPRGKNRNINKLNRKNAPQLNPPPHRLPPLLPPRLNPPNLNRDQLQRNNNPESLPKPTQQSISKPIDLKWHRLNVRLKTTPICTSPCTTGTVERELGGYAESLTDDGSAGRGHEIFGWVYGGIVYGKC
jgi:hypothetical protein